MGWSRRRSRLYRRCSNHWRGRKWTTDACADDLGWLLWRLADGSESVVLEGALGISLSPDACWLAVRDRAGRAQVIELDWDLD